MNKFEPLELLETQGRVGTVYRSESKKAIVKTGINASERRVTIEAARIGVAPKVLGHGQGWIAMRRYDTNLHNYRLSNRNSYNTYRQWLGERVWALVTKIFQETGKHPRDTHEKNVVFDVDSRGKPRGVHLIDFDSMYHGQPDQIGIMRGYKLPRPPAKCKQCSRTTQGGTKCKRLSSCRKRCVRVCWQHAGARYRKGVGCT